MIEMMMMMMTMEMMMMEMMVTMIHRTFMNQKANALTDFNSTPVVPDYVDVDASGFASNFLPGNNQGFLQQKITMKNNAMANGKPFKLQLRLSYVDGGQRGQVSFEVPSVSSPANTFAGAVEQPQRSGAKWAVDLMDRQQ
uniref:GAE domain-containing protein n=1 Tax=Hanusia phi TaxID=3032 RepID=A0A7S0EUX1_9CRYP|mmetsp:Transcript_3173/g.7631  ORF Transcript_3173/g.7631 Transcript_3173/m.7631 type:complete len:140 (+) Transcript_3173:3-422(+)